MRKKETGSFENSLEKHTEDQYYSWIYLPAEMRILSGEIV